METAAPATKTAAAITQSPESEQFDFFAELAKLDPGDIDLLDSIKEVELAAPEVSPAQFNANAILKAGAIKGALTWAIGLIKGKGTADGKTGAGAFTGNIVPESLAGGGGVFGFSGTYKLWITRFGVKLELYDIQGSLACAYEGNGSQQGLVNNNDQPWTGTWV